MKDVLFRWGNLIFQILIYGAIALSTLALGGVWRLSFAATFALLVAGFSVWFGLRAIAGRRRQGGSQRAHSGRRSLDRLQPAMARHGNSKPDIRDANGDADASDDDDEDEDDEDDEDHGRGRHDMPRDLASHRRGLTMGRVPRLRLRSPLGAALFLALIGYIWLQVLPLPTSVVSMLSPNRVALEQRFRAALDEPLPSMLSLSVDPANSMRAMALLGAAIMAFTAGAYLATRRRTGRRTVRVFLVIVIAEAIYGLIENLTGHNHVLWMPMHDNFASGTFFNRNHFAALLAFSLPVVIGWFFYSASAAKSSHDESHLLPATALDVLGTRQGLWLLPPAVIVLAIVQSQSRGGFASMLLGVGLLFAIGARTKSVRSLAMLAVPLACLLLFLGIQSDFQDVFARFGQLQDNVQREGRVRIWADSLGIVRDFPVFGVGLGNFPHLYMQYASRSTLDYPYQAHNEWLESLIVLGAIGTLLLAVLVIGFLIRSYRRINHTGSDQPWLFGVWCGMIGLLAHSFAEFNFHIPSIAITAALFAGILSNYTTAAQRSARARGRRRRESTRSGENQPGNRRVIQTFPSDRSHDRSAPAEIRPVPELEETPVGAPEHNGAD